MGVKQVDSWAKAVKSCTNGVWEDVELEANNQLTMWLADHDRKKFEKNWNKLVDQHKAESINRLSEEKWIPFQKEHGLDISIVHSARWDVLGALMENSYMSSNHRCFFFLELLMVYEAGHFPCGWQGEWPEGALVVY
jgi:hypothetical protein